MPIYALRCTACGYERELILSSARYYARIARILECDRCKAEGAWKKLPTAANIIFKGSDWGKK